MKEIITKSDTGTRRLGQKIAGSLRGGEVLALVGELGAGKTTFVKGLAEYFGISPQVSSPTFTLINEYAIKPNKLKNYKLQALIHIDCYRLNNPKELLDIGFKDYLDRPDSALVIEWADKVKNILSPGFIWIYFKHGKSSSARKIKINNPEI